MAATIDTYLTADPYLDLLGAFSVVDAGVNMLRIQKMVHLAAPYVVIFLGVKLTSFKTRTRFHGAIVDSVTEVDCGPIIYWLRVTPTQKIRYNHPSLLMMSQPTAQIMYNDLLWHHHNFLVRHLPGLYPSIQCAQVSLITTHTRLLGMELLQE